MKNWNCNKVLKQWSLMDWVVLFTEQVGGVERIGLNLFTIAASGLVLASGSYFSYLRVSQQLHTMSQVVVGAAIGSIFSTLWYFIWNAFVLDAFISSIWVRVVIIFGSAGTYLGFFLFAIPYWFLQE
ncbi:hypothetical protein Lal_00026447 [Lupinus albus]|uniref:Putative phosphatidate phosphatase n=1 Tax=Lupinus albus TaxID=3870 RepID=A0A6A5LTK1_LUPAL|nr:putative phosphatidate phosphatase [Lupinus albus]KAF1861952.1 hypothetical protein Lal_00026447 [Lupinus albus]